MHRRSFLREQCMHRCILSQHFQRPRSWLKRASFGAKVPRPRNRSGDRPRGGPRTSSRGGGSRLSRGGPRKSCRSRSRKPLPRAGRQAQPEPSRPLSGGGAERKGVAAGSQPLSRRSSIYERSSSMRSRPCGSSALRKLSGSSAVLILLAIP